MTNLIKELLIATGNKGKLSEIADLLSEIGIKAIGSFDYNLTEPEEIGKNFEENSLIKARYYGDKTGFLALADDSGLCIDLLDGQPGIYSARWAICDHSKEKNFSMAFERIESALINKGVDPKYDKIAAHFTCNLSIYDPKTKSGHSFEGAVYGRLTFPGRGSKGFGYDPIFIPEGYGKTFGEMEPKEKEEISHRSKAFEQLANWMRR